MFSSAHPLAISLTLILVAFQGNASSSYIDDGTLNRVLSGDLGAGSGVGTTSCTLCHTNESGGLNNVNTGFGADFESAGGERNQTSDELLTVLQAMYTQDSDGDGANNREEFAQCSNPNNADESVATTACTAASSGESSGGCGRTIAAGGPGSGGGPTSFLLLALLALPILLIFGLRRPRALRIR